MKQVQAYHRQELVLFYVFTTKSKVHDQMAYYKMKKETLLPAGTGLHGIFLKFWEQACRVPFAKPIELCRGWLAGVQYRSATLTMIP